MCVNDPTINISTHIHVWRNDNNYNYNTFCTHYNIPCEMAPRNSRNISRSSRRISARNVDTQQIANAKFANSEHISRLASSRDARFAVSNFAKFASRKVHNSRSFLAIHFYCFPYNLCAEKGNVNTKQSSALALQSTEAVATDHLAAVGLQPLATETCIYVLQYETCIAIYALQYCDLYYFVDILQLSARGFV